MPSGGNGWVRLLPCFCLACMPRATSGGHTERFPACRGLSAVRLLKLRKTVIPDPSVSEAVHGAERDPLHQGIIVERAQLKQRDFSLDLTSRLGKSQVITNTTPLNQQVCLPPASFPC